MLDLCERSTNAVIGAWTRGKSFEECLAHVRESVTPYQARIAELEAKNAQLRDRNNRIQSAVRDRREARHCAGRIPTTSELITENAALRDRIAELEAENADLLKTKDAEIKRFQSVVHYQEKENAMLRLQKGEKVEFKLEPTEEG